MASTDALPIPKKNTAFRVIFPIFDADGDLVTGATGLDSEVSKDQGTFADCTNEATEIATSSGMYYLDLTSTEMNADCVSVIVKTSSSGAKTTPIVLYPQEAGDIPVDVQSISGDSTAADNAEAFFDGTGYAGTNNVIPTVNTFATGAITSSSFAAGAINAAAIATGAIDADAIASDAVTEIQAGLSTLTAADIRTAVGLASANLDTQLGALPTASENALAVWSATTSGWGGGEMGELLVNASDTATTIFNVTNKLDTAMESDGLVYRFTTNALEQAPSGGSAPTAAAIADAVWDEATSGHTTSGTFGEQLKTDVDAILADTNELQTDWANGGRLDLLIDGIKAKTDLISEIYHADIDLRIDDANTRDDYRVIWWKDGERITSAITVPTLQAIKQDNTDLIEESAMTANGYTFTYRATGAERLTAGQSVEVLVTATINGGTRTYSAVVGRDSE